MSWSAGSKLFLDMWPLIKKHIPDDQLRAEFVAKQIKVFTDSDMDPMSLLDIDPELDRLLGHESGDNDHEESVWICIRDLQSSDLARRKTAAEAIEYFVGCAGGSLAQEATNALVAAIEGDQSDEFLIVALTSLREFVWEENAKVDPGAIEPLLSSPNTEIAERARFVMNGLNR